MFKLTFQFPLFFYKSFYHVNFGLLIITQVKSWSNNLSYENKNTGEKWYIKNSSFWLVVRDIVDIVLLISRDSAQIQAPYFHLTKGHLTIRSVCVAHMFTDPILGFWQFFCSLMSFFYIVSVEEIPYFLCLLTK